MSETITLKAADGHAFPAYIARPAGPAKGGVVVLQEIFGVNSHIRSVADRYAAAGYFAVAPSTFSPSFCAISVFALKHASFVQVPASGSSAIVPPKM